MTRPYRAGVQKSHHGGWLAVISRHEPNGHPVFLFDRRFATHSEAIAWAHLEIGLRRCLPQHKKRAA